MVKDHNGNQPQFPWSSIRSNILRLVVRDLGLGPSYQTRKRDDMIPFLHSIEQYGLNKAVELDSASSPTAETSPRRSTRTRLTASAGPSRARPPSSTASSTELNDASSYSASVSPSYVNGEGGGSAHEYNTRHRGKRVRVFTDPGPKRPRAKRSGQKSTRNARLASASASAKTRAKLLQKSKSVRTTDGEGRGEQREVGGGDLNSVVPDVPVKRGRGRPRKYPRPDGGNEENASLGKRKRGKEVFDGVVLPVMKTRTPDKGKGKEPLFTPLGDDAEVGDEDAQGETEDEHEGERTWIPSADHSVLSDSNKENMSYRNSPHDDDEPTGEPTTVSANVLVPHVVQNGVL